MQTLPEYLTPGAAPATGGDPARRLHELRGACSVGAGIIGDIAARRAAFEKLSEEEKAAAAAACGIDPKDLERFAEACLSALPAKTPFSVQKDTPIKPKKPSAD